MAKPKIILTHDLKDGDLKKRKDTKKKAFSVLTRELTQADIDLAGKENEPKKRG